MLAASLVHVAQRLVSSHFERSFITQTDNRDTVSATGIMADLLHLSNKLDALQATQSADVSDLQATKDDLAATKARLATAEQLLAAAQADIVVLRADLTATRSDLSDLQTQTDNTEDLASQLEGEARCSLRRYRTKGIMEKRSSTGSRRHEELFKLLA